MARLAIIADDLTGAADAAAAFAPQLATYVSLRLSETPGTEVIAIATGGRDLPLPQAIDRSRAAATALASSDLVFCKIDSTLRGHPVELLDAVRAASGRKRVVIAPAFPAEGRTTLGGRQLLRGAPLEQTPFAAQVATSDLRALWPAAGHVPLATLRASTRDANPLAGAELVVADAATDEDLRLIALLSTQAGFQLLCGSAGLARVIPVTEESRREGQSPVQEPPRGPALIVAGSQHEATARQVEALRRQEIAVFPAKAWREAAAQLERGFTVALTTDGMADPVDQPLVARRVAAWAGELLQRVRVAGLVLTGGEVAAAVLGAAGARGLWLAGELAPGLPLGNLDGGRFGGLPVATKAGGFGGPEALVELADSVSRLAPSA